MIKSKFSNKYGLNEIILVIVRIENNKIFSDLLLISNKSFEKKIELNHNQFEKFFKTLEIETLNMWKEINKIQNKSLNKINCKIKYFNLLELKEIKII